MNIANERKLAARAKDLGESASALAWPELAELARSESPLVRRLAASAVGKLAGIVDSVSSVDLLRPMLADAHPQVRQYAAKALSAFGAAATDGAPRGTRLTQPHSWESRRTRMRVGFSNR